MGIACIYVVLTHFADLSVGQTIYHSNPFFMFAACGNVGVDIFLLLSGLGLFYSYSKDRSFFYRKRIVRILVPYVLICVPFFIWKDIIVSESSFIKDVTQISFFTDGMRTTWYIPAIFIFYMVFPLFYNIIFKRKNTGMELIQVRITLICIGTMLLCFVLMMLFNGFYNNTEIMLTRFMIFIIGIYVGVLSRNENRISLSKVIIAFAFFFMYVFCFRSMVDTPAYWTRFIYAALAISITVMCAFVLSKRGHSKVLGFFGKRSLEIYLFHVLIRYFYFYYFSGNADNYYVIDYLIIVGISVLLSIVFHVIIKKLSKSILDKIQRSKT